MTEKNSVPAWHSLVSGTEDQRAALQSEAPLTVVSAGAGTGKTQTLSQRFAWLLASDPSCGIGEILVLTFTKKAAAEMLERIKKTLSAWYSAYPDELSHLRERIESIDDAYISTIHAFAMKLIRESGLALDIDPSAAMMPAPKEDIWWREFTSALSSSSFGKISRALPGEWRGRAEELFASPDFTDVLNSLTPEAVAGAARTCTEKLYCAGQSPEELWDNDGSALETSIASMKNVRRDIYSLWMNGIFPALELNGAMGGGKKKTKTLERLCAFLERWRGHAPRDDGELAEFCAGLFDDVLKPLPSGGVKKDIEDIIDCPLSAWRGEFAGKLALLEPPSEAEKRINRLLRRACAVGWACWDEFRRREGLISMADLICYASKVVESSPEYRTKFKHIMVDEFQDTDPLQNALIESLWNGGRDGATLFVVGDQKQSIYRFRHADLELFRGYTARARGGGTAKYIVLGQNFRTAKRLLEKFNGLFGGMWKGESSVLYEALTAPENDAASARRDGASVPYPRFSVLRAVSPYSDEKDEKPEKRPDAAALRLRLYAGLGRRFAAMMEEKAPVWDKSAEAFRPVRWSDFAVLVQTRAEYSDIERAFERLGLPYVLSTSKDYFGRGETGDLVNMISLLASPDDPLFLAGWLASPFCGLSAGEAGALIEAAYAERGRRGPLPLAAVVRRLRPDVWKRLDGMRRRALLGGVSAVLLDLLKSPSFLENYAGLRRLRVNANVVYLAGIAAEYERSEGKSLKGCAEYLLTASSSGSAKEEPELFGDGVDAVRVMTVHASKGLEFPVVALTVSDKGRAALPPVFVSKKYGVAAKDYPEYLEGAGTADGDGRTAAYRWEKAAESAAGREELERLWYVGFTRARDRLILCGIYKEPKDKEAAPPNFLGSVMESGLCDECEELTEDDAGLPKYARYESPSGGAALELKTVSPAKLARISASAYSLLSWCPAAYRMIYRQGRSAGWIVKGGGAGSDFGVLAHWVLARWDFRADGAAQWLPEKRGAEWRRVYLRLPAPLRGEYGSGAKRAELREMLVRFAATEECALLAELDGKGGGLLQRETRFRVPLNGTVLIGTTDLFWRDSGGLHLRDWKTAPEETAPSFYYEKQLEFYACALNRFLESTGEGGAQIDSALIYLRGSAAAAARRYVPGDFASIEEEIEKAAVRAVSGDFRGIKERCGRCPWRGDCPEK